MSEEIIGCVIVNWNGLQHLRRCLSSLINIKVDEGIEVKVIVADNGSTDGSFELVQEYRYKYRKEKVSFHPLQLGDNWGFEAANNYGVKYALTKLDPSPKFIATLNNDTEVKKHWLSELLRCAQQNEGKKIGMYAPKIYFLENKQRIYSTGHIICKNGAVYDRDYQNCEENQHKGDQKEIFCSCFAGSLLSAKMLREILGKMERSEYSIKLPTAPPEIVEHEYFMYNDCNVLGWKAQLNGWKAQYVDKAVMYHRHQKSITDKTVFIRERNRIWNILRFFPGEKQTLAINKYKNESRKSCLPKEYREDLVKIAKMTFPRKFNDSYSKRCENSKIYKEYCIDCKKRK